MLRYSFNNVKMSHFGIHLDEFLFNTIFKNFCEELKVENSCNVVAICHKGNKKLLTLPKKKGINETNTITLVCGFLCGNNQMNYYPK